MKISRKLNLGFGACALAVALMGGVGFLAMQQVIQTTSRIIEVDLKLVEHAQRMRANINMMRRYEKDLFLSASDGASQAKYEKQWQEAREHAKERMGQIKKLESEPKDLETMTAIERGLDSYAAGFTQVASRLRTGAIKSPVEANLTIAEFKESTHKAETEITAYAAKQDEDIGRLRKDLEDGNRRSQLVLLTIIGSTLVGVAVLSRLITQSIRQPLDDIEALVVDMGQGEGDLSRTLAYSGSDELGAICTGINHFVSKLRDTISQVASTAEQVASATHELSATAEQMNTTTVDLSQSAERQRVAMTQSSAALEEMSASISQVRASAADAEKIAAGSLDMSALGNGAAGDCTKAMNAIEDSSEKVNRITLVIADIARQTNLLSLNAAIEAAKAGAQGKGFAVVAEEVRKLAERSGSAAKEITAQIEESRERVGLGTGAVESVSRSLHAIEEATQSSTDRIRGISLAMEEQLKASQEMVAAVSTTANITDQNASATTQLAATIHEVAQTIEALARIANELKFQTARFKLA